MLLGVMKKDTLTAARAHKPLRRSREQAVTCSTSAICGLENLQILKLMQLISRRACDATTAHKKRPHRTYHPAFNSAKNARAESRRGAESWPCTLAHLC